jgi:DNA-binding CsgD family transcriptional regulator
LGYQAAAPEYSKAVAFCRDAHPQELAPWTNLITAVTTSIWDDASHELLLGRIAEWSRAQGSLFPLWLALFYLATSAERRGDFTLQTTLLDQAADVLSITGPFSVPRIGVELDALRGREISEADEALETSETVDQASAYAMHDRLLRAQIGIASYDEALGHARVLFDADPVMFGPHLLPDMIEAAVRVGDIAAAEQAVARLIERATASGTQWALGLLARSEALVATDAGAGEYYLAALEQLGSTTMQFEQARTHLLYGEWLRRTKRNIDARAQLRHAHEMFSAMEAQSFIERARVELLATGGRARKRTVDTSNDLTPQEAQIAKLVSRGAPNREIANQLFISQSTVEYHLHKVFRKLGVTSRTQLARLVLETDQAS